MRFDLLRRLKAAFSRHIHPGHAPPSEEPNVEALLFHLYEPNMLMVTARSEMQSNMPNTGHRAI